MRILRKMADNGGAAFKVTCRGTADGVMVTIIADNDFGYCKKEVKTQDQLRWRQSFWSLRGGACRRSHGLRQL